MNPSHDNGPELQLPAPVGHVEAPLRPIGQALPLPELAPSLMEQAPTAAQLPPIDLSQLPAPILAQSVATSVQAVAQPTTNILVPHTADDQDLIEKEWVAKAKQIINKTQNDPHQQSEDLTIFKSDYMQKRYNKTTKMSQ